MKQPKVSVLVGGVMYPVREHAEILKADMNGYFGWTNIWASDLEDLKRRIKRVRSGGQ